MVAVRIPGVLLALTDHQPQVTVDAPTLATLIDALDARCPGMRERLLDESGLRRYINVYVNARDVRYGQGLATELGERDVVWILPTSSGGMAAR